MKTGAQQLRQFIRVRDIAVDRERGDRRRIVRLAGAWLVPVHDHKMVFQPREILARPGEFATTWTTREEEQHGFMHVPAANRDPLIAAAEIHLFQRRNAIGKRLALCIRDRRRRCKHLRDHNRDKAHGHETRQRGSNR
jgi:hypothetical protein